MQFERNFTGLISNSSPWAYIIGFLLNNFWLSYGPWKKRGFLVSSKSTMCSFIILGNWHFLHYTEITQAFIVTVKLHFSTIRPSVCPVMSVWLNVTTLNYPDYSKTTGAVSSKLYRNDYIVSSQLCIPSTFYSSLIFVRVVALQGFFQYLGNMTRTHGIGNFSGVLLTKFGKKYITEILKWFY